MSWSAEIKMTIIDAGRCRQLMSYHPDRTVGLVEECRVSSPDLTKFSGERQGKLVDGTFLSPFR